MTRIKYFQQGGAYPRYDLTKHPNFRMPHYKHPGQVTMDGKTYPMRVTTGMWNPWDIPLNNDESYAIDPETGKVRQLDENIFGRTTGKWAKDSEWEHVPILHRDLWRKHNPNATFDTEDALYREAIWGLDLGYLSPEDPDSLDNRAKTKKHQQGGTMTAQQDIKAQVTALVQAAMQGDEKAASTVNQIIEAAKSGDQQAMQLAQMIQQVMQQMQGQTASARLGAKLNYIRSLKYAKGGKTCPACEKRVEMKACGGKKAKKRYFGGLI